MAIKFRILQENFQKALEAVGPAATGRTTINALYGVLITAKDDVITLSATDLELRIDAQAPALIFEEGQAMVKYQTLHNQIRSLPSEPVEVELIEAKDDEINGTNTASYAQILSVSCGHASARLYCENTNSFPPPPENDEHTQAEIPTDALGRAIRMVSCCVATDEGRTGLTSVALSVNPSDGTLTTSAADGFRLTKMEVPCEIKGEEEIPHRLILMLTNPGDLVLDPFLGSGQTAKTAVWLDRNAVGYDIQPEYVRLVQTRIQEPRRLRQQQLVLTIRQIN